MTLEDRAIADHQTLRRDVADNGTWGLNFQFFIRGHIRHDFALNQNRSGGNFALNRCLLSDRHMTLGDDLTFNFAINGCLTVEV